MKVCWLFFLYGQGYNVVGADVQELNKDEKLDDRAFKFVLADISNPVDAKRVVDASVEAHGGHIHVLINNAGRLFDWHREKSQV